MCLITIMDSGRKVAERDIPCVKALRRGLFGLRWTPFRNRLVCRGVYIGKRWFIAKGQEDVYGYASKVVNGGFVHTYKDEETARLYTRNLRNIEFYECVIPAGTEYYEGCDDYASKCIRFGKLIK